MIDDESISYFPCKCGSVWLSSYSIRLAVVSLIKILGWGGITHWHGILLCMCHLLGYFLANFGILMGGFSSHRNWVYLEEIIVKSTQFGKIVCIFKNIGIFMCGMEPKISILKVELSNFHIKVNFMIHSLMPYLSKKKKKFGSHTMCESYDRTFCVTMQLACSFQHWLVVLSPSWIPAFAILKYLQIQWAIEIQYKWLWSMLNFNQNKENRKKNKIP